ncbi:MAG: PAS domain S-box-containing protein, partial [Bacteroidia bacterium]
MKAVPDISPKVVRPKVDALLKILILEDMPADTELVVRELMEADLHYELAICRTDEEFDSQTKSFCPTIILTPYSLSYTNAVKAFKRAREEGCNAPFILLAQDLSEDIAIELLKTGIEDYVLRSSLKRLPIAIKKALLKDRTQRELQLSKDLVKASKASLINMVKNMPMAVAMFDANMQYIVVSEQWLKDEGFTEKELIGKRHYEVNPDLPEHWRKVHQDCLNGSTKAVEKEKITRSNGAEAYIRWKINPWYSPDGRIGGIVLFIEDITAKVATEEEVRSKEQSLRMAQKVGNIGSFEIDVDTRMLTWSDQLYQIIGIDFQDVTYESVIQLVHPDDRERFDSETDSRAATGQPEKVDYRIITPNGEIKFIHSRAKLVKATDGKGPKLVGIVQDMTAQRLMAEEADQNADRLQLAINASNLGVWEWNGVTQRAYYDDQCKSIVGRPGFNSDNLEDLISIVHPEDLSEIQNCFATSVTESGKLNV